MVSWTKYKYAGNAGDRLPAVLANKLSEGQLPYGFPYLILHHLKLVTPENLIARGPGSELTQYRRLRPLPRISILSFDKLLLIPSLGLRGSLWHLGISDKLLLWTWRFEWRWFPNVIIILWYFFQSCLFFFLSKIILFSIMLL